MRRFIVWSLILVVIAGGIALAVAPSLAWLHKQRQPTYLTAKVTRGSVETTVNSTGTVKAVRTVSIGAFTSGPLSDVFVDFNSRVTEGQVLALIDPKLLTASVERDRAFLETQIAERERVKALLQQAKNNEDRAISLYKVSTDYISAVEMDQYRYTRAGLEAQLNLAKASIKQAEATLKNSEANLGYTKITSPVNGIVIERKVDPGQTVASSFQTPELFVVAPNMEKEMHIFATVDEADIGMIRDARERKQDVSFTIDAYPLDLFKGKIHQIRMNSTTTQNVVTYPVVISTSNADLKLMPGMTANITFHIETKENVIRVPMSALRFVPLAAQVHEDDRHYLDNLAAAPSGSQRRASEKVEQSQKRRQRVVWVREDEWLRARPVTLGLIENQFAEILTGELPEGTELVTGVETSIGGAR